MRPWLGVLALGCRVSYAIAPQSPPAALRPAVLSRADSSEALPRVRGLESSCRAGLSHQTFRQALAARDRVLGALGAACDMEEVETDRLHWLFRCRSEALFAAGRYELSPGSLGACQGVAALRGLRVNPWVCVGALLHELEGTPVPLGHIELAVIGHVDGIRVLNFSACPELNVAFGRSEAVFAAPTTDAEREAANDRLAWCRAASVADKIRCGLRLAERGSTSEGAPGDPCASFGVNPRRDDLSVVGASSTFYRWFRGQSDRACSAPRPEEPAEGNCIEARRVDVFVRYVPRAQSASSSCSHGTADETSSLHCLQDCVEEATAHAESAAAASSPLHVSCSQAQGARPAGWLGLPQLVPSATCRTLDLGLVQRALGLSR